MENKNGFSFKLSTLIAISVILIIIIIALVVSINVLKSKGNTNVGISTTEEKTENEKTSGLFSSLSGNKKPVSKRIPSGVETVTEDLIPYMFNGLAKKAQYAFQIKSEDSNQENSTSNYEEEQTPSVFNYNSENIKNLYVEIEEFNLPTNLFDYKDKLIFRITYSKDDYTVYECKILDKYSEEEITDLSKENFEKLYNIEYEKEIIKIDWTEKINLSELEENKVYEFVPLQEDSTLPKVINDLQYDCILYEKEINDFFDKGYKEVAFLGTIKVNGMYKTPSFGSSIDTDEAWRIMYRKAETEDLLKTISEDEIIYVADYNSGSQIDADFEDYIYNNTEHVVTLNATKIELGEDPNTGEYGIISEENDSFVLNPGEIYGYDWFFDQVIVEY